MMAKSLYMLYFVPDMGQMLSSCVASGLWAGCSYPATRGECAAQGVHHGGHTRAMIVRGRDFDGKPGEPQRRRGSSRPGCAYAYGECAMKIQTLLNQIDFGHIALSEFHRAGTL